MSTRRKTLQLGKVYAKKFGSRADLDFYIQNLRESDKEGLVIVGTEEELADLQLSNQTRIYGVPCLLTVKK